MNLLVMALPYIQIVLSIGLVAGVLLQTSSSGLGGAFGEGNNFDSGFHTRRGFEKYLYNATLVMAVLFAISAFVALKI